MSNRTDQRQNISEIIDASPLTGRQWLFFGLIFSLILADGMDTTIISHTFPSLVSQWGVSIGGGISLVVTASFLAMGVGALIAGRLGDRWGRKAVLIAAAIFVSAGTALGGTAPDFYMFMIWRLVASLGIGGVMPVALTLLTELVPAKRRAAMLTASFAGTGIGSAVGAALAGVLIPTFGWQTLLYVGGAIPLVITILIWAIVPESPLFFASVGSLDGVRNSMKSINPRTNINLLELPVVDSSTSSRGAMHKLFKAPLRARTILITSFAFLALSTQVVIVQYLPLLLQLPVPGMTTVQSSNIVASYALAGVLSTLILSLFLARWHYFPVIGLCLGLGAIVAFAVSLSHNASYSTLFIVMTAAGFFLTAPLGPTANMIAVDAYPDAMRSSGLGITGLSARVGSATLGASGGVLVGAGVGFGGFFLTLLIPFSLLGMALIGIRSVLPREPKPLPQSHKDYR